MNLRARRVILIVLAACAIVGVLGLALSGRSLLWQPFTMQSRQPLHGPGGVLQGQVRAADRLTLKAPVAGKVVALGASEGLLVTTDQLIAQIDSAPARQLLQAARADLQRVQAGITKSEKTGIGEQLRLALTQQQSAAAQRLQADKALADFTAKQPAAVRSADDLTQAEQKAAASAKVYAATSAALDAAHARANQTGKPDPNLENLEDAFHRARTENGERQGELNEARQTRITLRDTLRQYDELKRNAASARKSDRQFTDALLHLRQSPAAQAVVKAEVTLSAAQARVAEVERLMASCALKAPEPGLLVELSVRPGTTVQAGQMVAVIERQGGARMVFEVPGNLAASVAVGMRVKVSPEGGRPFAASVSQVVPGKTQSLVYLEPLGKASVPAPGTPLTARLR